MDLTMAFGVLTVLVFVWHMYVTVELAKKYEARIVAAREEVRNFEKAKQESVERRIHQRFYSTPKEAWVEAKVKADMQLVIAEFAVIEERAMRKRAEAERDAAIDKLNIQFKMATEAPTPCGKCLQLTTSLVEARKALETDTCARCSRPWPRCECPEGEWWRDATKLVEN